MRALAAALLALGLGAGGCATAPEPAPEPELTGELRQFRGGAAQRTAQVTVRTRVPVTVLAVRLQAPGLQDGPAGDDDEVVLPAGAVVDLPVRYGSADCTRSPGAASALLTVRRAGGQEQLEVPLEDRGLLARLHEADCAEQALAAAVDLSLLVDPAAVRGQDGRTVLGATLVLQRRTDGEPVVVQELGSHIVFTVRPEVSRTPLLALAPSAPRGELRVSMTPTRCDGHALAENKRAGVLSAYIALGDAAPRLVTVAPDEAGRVRMVDTATAGCRAG